MRIVIKGFDWLTSLLRAGRDIGWEAEHRHQLHRKAQESGGKGSQVYPADWTSAGLKRKRACSYFYFCKPLGRTPVHSKSSRLGDVNAQLLRKVYPPGE